MTSTSFSSTRCVSDYPTLTSTPVTLLHHSTTPLPLPLRSTATASTRSACQRRWMWTCSTHHCPVGWSPLLPYRHSPPQLQTIHPNVRPTTCPVVKWSPQHMHLQSVTATICIACDCDILLSLGCLGYPGPPSPTPSTNSGYRESPLMQRRRLERKFRT